MKLHPFVLVGLSLSLGIGSAFAQAPPPRPEPPSPNSPNGLPANPVPADPEKVMRDGSYALGLMVATQFGEVNFDEFKKGLTDQLENKPKRLKDEELNGVLRPYAEMARNKKSAAAAKMGTDYLATNGKKAGVKTTPSGLQYEVVKEGKGAKPRATDRVSVHYHGTLVDGTVFDSSVQRGTPAEFGVNEVIRGWTEALGLMAVGSKWKLAIPAELAYGDQPTHPGIPPKSVLLFDVELLEILKRDTAPGGAVTPPVPVPQPK